MVGREAWGSATLSDTSNLLTLQKKALMILTGNKYFQIYGEPPGALPHSNPLNKSLEILKFEDIFKISIINPLYMLLYQMKAHQYFLIGSRITILSTIMLQNPQLQSSKQTILIWASLSRLKLYILRTQNKSYMVEKWSVSLDLYHGSVYHANFRNLFHFQHSKPIQKVIFYLYTSLQTEHDYGSVYKLLFFIVSYYRVVIYYE